MSAWENDSEETVCGEETKGHVYLDTLSHNLIPFYDDKGIYVANIHVYHAVKDPDIRREKLVVYDE